MIIEGANGKWQKGSEDGLSFTSNAAFADFQKVQVDGNDVDSSNYTVKEGSTVVTLKPSYLETLSVGKHMLAIVSDTGTAETEFTVLAAEGEAVDSKVYPCRRLYRNRGVRSEKVSHLGFAKALYESYSALQAILRGGFYMGVEQARIREGALDASPGGTRSGRRRIEHGEKGLVRGFFTP